MYPLAHPRFLGRRAIAAHTRPPKDSTPTGIARARIGSRRLCLRSPPALQWLRAFVATRPTHAPLPPCRGCPELPEGHQRGTHLVFPPPSRDPEHPAPRSRTSPNPP